MVAQALELVSLQRSSLEDRSEVESRTREGCVIDSVHITCFLGLRLALLAFAHSYCTGRKVPLSCQRVAKGCLPDLPPRIHTVKQDAERLVVFYPQACLAGHCTVMSKQLTARV